LFLAKNLLRDDGVIFISIDDHEVQNLRLLMDEVFGEENFLDCIIWKKRYGGGAKEKHLVTLHEYILFYAKNKELVENIFIPNSQDAIDRYYKLKDGNHDLRGPYRTHPLEATKSVGDRKNLIYPIQCPDGTQILPKRQWQWSKDRALVALAKNELEIVKGKDGWSVNTKQYLRDENGDIRQSKAFSMIENVYSQHGTTEFNDLLGDPHIFSFPKPSRLIKPLINIADASNGIILDFFAGSGTTAQAVLELNQEDGGNRKFILVQLPEKTENKQFPTIADITRERVRRVIDKMNAANAAKLPIDEDAPDRGFKAFRLTSSNFKVWDGEAVQTDASELAVQLEAFASNVLPSATPDAMLYEIMLRAGLEIGASRETLTMGGQTVENIGNGALLVCLEPDIHLSTLRAMIAARPRMVVCLDTALHGDDALLTNAELEAKAAKDVTFYTV